MRSWTTISPPPARRSLSTAVGLGTVFLLSGGVLRASTPVGEGESYRVWSYTPDPAPRSLARAPASYPSSHRPLPRDRRAPPVSRFRPARARAHRAARSSTIRRTRVSHAIGRCTTWRDASLRGRETPYARGARDRVVASPDRWLHLRRVAAASEGRSARLVRDADEGRLLPALRRGDGRNAADAGDSRSRRSRLHERHAGRRNVGRDRSRRACVGRGVVRGHRVGSVRSDPGPRHARRRVLVRVRLRGCHCTPEAWRARRVDDAGTPAARSRCGRLARDHRRVQLPTGTVVGRRSRSFSPRSGSCFSEWGRHLSGALAICRAILAASRRRAVASSRTSCAIRASTFRRTRRSWGCSRAVHDELGLDGRAFAAVVARARFGPPTLGRGGASPRREVRRLIRAARRELSLWARFRGLVSLRSLRSANGS